MYGRAMDDEKNKVEGMVPICENVVVYQQGTHVNTE